MRLEGSCSCGAVKFSLSSTTPYPYMRCYCSICRKTAGGGGYAINIMGDATSLKVRGAKNVSIFRARVKEAGAQKASLSKARRHFCAKCGSALWVSDPRWAEWVYPFASAIDTPLPKPREIAHIMLDSKAPWVEVPGGKRNHKFAEYPDQSIEDWHKTRGVYEK